MTWQNRIVGYGEEAPDQILANPRNWRVHPRNQQDALAGILSEVGVVQNVIVNQRTGFLIDGHLRVSLALRDNQPSVPVTYVDLSPEEEALILATLDPLAAMAATDAEQLRALLDDVATEDAKLAEMLTALNEFGETSQTDRSFLDSAISLPSPDAISGDDFDPGINKLVIPVTPEERNIIMSAVRRIKQERPEIETTTAALVLICEGTLWQKG